MRCWSNRNNGVRRLKKRFVAMSSAIRSPGFHGKLPSRGDFVAFGLTGAFLTAWDLWLAAGLEAARADYGPDWEGLLDSGPAWRFALPPGLWAAGPVIGVMQPSRDKVERRFPFVIACELSPPAPLAAVPVLCRGWFERAEMAARLLVAKEAEPLTARRAANALGAPPVLDREACAAAAAAVVDLIGPATEGVSLWWCRGRGVVAGSVAAAPGMPTARMFVALLDGEWAAHGWRDLDRSYSAAAQ
jgi:type VI secretion system protein ImpM